MRHQPLCLSADSCLERRVLQPVVSRTLRETWTFVIQQMETPGLWCWSEYRSCCCWAAQTLTGWHSVLLHQDSQRRLVWSRGNVNEIHLPLVWFTFTPHLWKWTKCHAVAEVERWPRRRACTRMDWPGLKPEVNPFITNNDPLSINQ